MASVNEHSTRYSEAIDSRYEAAEWRLQSQNNKQGSKGVLGSWEEVDYDPGEYTDPGTIFATPAEYLTESEKKFHEMAQSVYEDRLKFGIAREIARKDLPLSTYTEAYWKIDLHNLLHFLSLRMDSHAQWEIRSYANVIGNDIVSKWVPLVWEAFQDYRMDSMGLTGIELEVVSSLVRQDKDGAQAVLERRGMLEPSKRGGWKRNRERQELEDKLQKLGFKVPW